MGAYENPPLLTPPNYGQIMMQNFWSVYKMTKEALAKPADPNVEARGKLVEKDYNTFIKKMDDFKAGGMVVNVEKELREKRKIFRKAGQKFKIDGDEDAYYNALDLANGYLDKTILGSETIVAENNARNEIQNISGYQPEIGVTGFYQAAAARNVIQHQNSETGEMIYAYLPTDQDGNLIINEKFDGKNDFLIVSESELRKRGVYGVVENRTGELNEIKTLMNNIHIKNQLNPIAEKNVKEENGMINTYSVKKFKTEGYNPINSILVDKQVTQFFADDAAAGSGYVDWLTKNYTSDEIYEKIISDQGTMSEADKSILKTIIEEQSFSNVTQDGHSLSEGTAKEYLIKAMKRFLADEIIQESGDMPTAPVRSGQRFAKEEEEGLSDEEKENAIKPDINWVLLPPDNLDALKKQYVDRKKWDGKTITDIKVIGGSRFMDGPFNVKFMLGKSGEQTDSDDIPTATIDLNDVDDRISLFNFNIPKGMTNEEIKLARELIRLP